MGKNRWCLIAIVGTFGAAIVGIYGDSNSSYAGWRRHRTGCVSEPVAENRTAKASRVAGFTKYTERQAGFSPQQLDWIEHNCLFGMPKKEWNFGETKIVPRKGFVLEHSTESKISLWVCEEVTPYQLSGEYDRDDLDPREPFQPDPMLSVGKRAELEDYKGYKDILDRGHMSPVGNQSRVLKLLAETYVLSNMVPQASSLNRGLWAHLEGRCREWAKKRKGAYIITGGFFYDPKEENAETADGIINHEIIGDNRVAVPTHIYKIIVSKNSSGDYEALAFVLKNKPIPGVSVDDLGDKEYLKSIDWIEERTGLNFMPKLTSAEEAQLERRAASALWPH